LSRLEKEFFLNVVMDVFSGKYLMALRTLVWSLAEIFWHGEKVEMKV